MSACLLGERVRFDGREKGSANPILERWQAEGRVVRVCPEVAGGLPVPRPPAELQQGRVIAQTGADVTAEFERGAREALRLIQAFDIRVAVLKSGSPSCGSGFVYDGTFSKTRVAGDGVTTALLQRHGVRVFSEHDWAGADAALTLP